MTQKYPGRPISNSRVHRMLSNPYYVGKISHRGVLYDGSHEPIISPQDWFTVQSIRASRKLEGDRAWRHSNYLKGSLSCGRCEGRIGFGNARGRGGVYSYFFCLGRHTGRTECDLPYVQIADVEQEVEKLWRRIQLTPEATKRTREIIFEMLEERVMRLA